MRPGRPTPLTLTRRALGTRLAGFAAAIGFGQSAATSVAAQPASALDLELRDAALRVSPWQAIVVIRKRCASPVVSA